MRAAVLVTLGSVTTAWVSTASSASQLSEQIDRPTAVRTLPADAAATPQPSPSRSVPSAAAGSRSDERQSLMSISQTTVPGCQALTTYPGQNGRLPASELCDLWPSPYQDRSDAVLALTALDVAYKAAFGTDMRLTSAYRTVEQQADLKRARGAFAAPPGQSNHGWGLAVDLCASVYEGQSGAWLRDVGPVYGWDNPAWALRGGGGPYEPWHWEYVPGVQALAAGGVGE